MAASSNDDDDGLITAINVTPLVDVVLVLLIIFMVTARIIHAQGMPMDLPKAASGEAIQTIFSVELGADSTTMVDSEKIAKDDAISPLAAAARGEDPELRAVSPCRRHGRARSRIHVLDLLKRAGIGKIAFATTPTKPIRVRPHPWTQRRSSPVPGRPHDDQRTGRSPRFLRGGEAGSKACYAVRQEVWTSGAGRKPDSLWASCWPRCFTASWVWSS